MTTHTALAARQDFSAQIAAMILNGEGFRDSMMDDPTAALDAMLSSAGLELPKGLRVEVTRTADGGFDIRLPSMAPPKPGLARLDDELESMQMMGCSASYATKVGSFCCSCP